jgi:DNA-binding response OmpR family regulator
MCRLLLIDDDPDFCDMLSAELKRSGHSVVCAASCDEGLDALARMLPEREIDAVLVDIFMPEIDGFETIHALREAGVAAPVIAISGGGSKHIEQVLDWATSLGADASLAKPFMTDRLMMLVDAFGPDQHWAQ